MEVVKKMTNTDHWPKAAIWALLERREIHPSEVELIVEVGSTIYGINQPGYDDLDLTAVRLEPFHELITGSSKRQSMFIRTQPEGVRSRFGDIDIQCYALRKFARLAEAGNPSILTALFSPNRIEGNAGVRFDQLASIVPSQSAGRAYQGYMKQQLERWAGKRGQKNVNRPELVEAHGYDTKYAGHVIRLGLQGIEYMKTGTLSLPMDDMSREVVYSIRAGRIPEATAIIWAEELELALGRSFATSPLPERPAKEAVTAWLELAYEYPLFNELAARRKGL